MKKYMYLAIGIVLAILLAIIFFGGHPSEEKAMAKAMANKERVEKLLRSTGRPGIEVVISHLDSTDFYTRGAGGHHTETGGLVQHSLEVYRIMRLVAWFQPHDSIVITAIFHDLGKIMWGWHPYRGLKLLGDLGFELTEKEYITILRHHRQQLHYFRSALRRALTFADVVSTGWWRLKHRQFHTVKEVEENYVYL